MHIIAWCIYSLFLSCILGNRKWKFSVLSIFWGAQPYGPFAQSVKRLCLCSSLKPFPKSKLFQKLVLVSVCGFFKVCALNRYSYTFILFCTCCSGVRTCLGQCGAKYMCCQVCIYLFWHHVFAAYLASIV